MSRWLEIQCSTANTEEIRLPFTECVILALLKKSDGESSGEYGGWGSNGSKSFTQDSRFPGLC